MSNATSQVPSKRHSVKLPPLSPELRLALEEKIGEQLEAEGYPVFLKTDAGGRRHYPGEAEAMHIIREVSTFSGLPPKGKRHEALLESLRILRGYEEASNTRNTRALAKVTRTTKAELERLRRTILSSRSFALGIQRQGLVVQPLTNRGITAFALLSLFEQQKVSRLRQCLHCHAWFYARFKHQQFCRNPSDPFSKCQWNHYHTPEWRRQHREQNKKHQRAYRQRTFGGPRCA